jgi:hypothetical protein
MKARRTASLIAGLVLGMIGFGHPRAQQPDDGVCAAQPSAKSAELQSFWRRFRKAALAGDYSEVAAMVDFPLTIADIVDDSNPRHVGRGAFNATFRRFLASDAGTDVNESSIRQFLERTPCLSGKELNTAGDGAQAARMVFVRLGSHWVLTEIFLSEDP